MDMSEYASNFLAALENDITNKLVVGFMPDEKAKKQIERILLAFNKRGVSSKIVLEAMKEAMID